MRAVVIDRPGGPESLRVAVVPVPSPGPGEVRVRVAAAAVNPVDVMARSGVFHRVGWIRQEQWGWVGTWPAWWMRSAPVSGT